MNKEFNSVENYLRNFSRDFDNILKSHIPNPPLFSNKLHKAMMYVIQVGGKRLRPILLSEISKILGVKEQYSSRVSVSLELIHCYSLVHDDLPAMDDDDIRRGGLTCHKKFDDATAILVGDAFQSLAFEILSSKNTHHDAEVRCQLIYELSKSSGSEGMVAGQVLDLEAEQKKLTLDQIFQLQRLKTGELFRFSCIAPCILSGRFNEIKIFEDFALKLGLAFQIKDDLLDIEGSTEEIGKKTQKDSSRGKETLLSLMGKKDAYKKSEELINDSLKILEPFGTKADTLVKLTKFIISRKK